MNLSEQIESAFPRVEKLFTERGLQEFKEACGAELEKFSCGVGSFLRLRLLRPNHRLYRAFVQSGVTDRYEMTTQVLAAYHSYLGQ